MKKSPTYNNPKLYSFVMTILHPFGELKNLKKLIGKKKTVFEPACGFGRLKKFLYKNCTYRGIDLNQEFIKFGQHKNINIKLGNMFEQKNYVSSDIIILCDIIHHLSIKQGKELVSIATKFTKEKIIIIEPTFTSIAAGNNWFKKQIAKVFSRLDYDGINHITKWLLKKEYYNLFEEYKIENKFKKSTIKEKSNYFFVELIK
jgi:SAM-dependent methyltransferase